VTDQLDSALARAGDAHVDAFIASLGLGRDACRSSYSISRQIGTPQRSIGFIANAARRGGHLVGSVHGEGYYLIETRDEFDATISHIAGRVAGIQRTSRMPRGLLVGQELGMNAYSTAEDRVRVMSLMRLQWILDDAPTARVAWTPLERAARDELDQRVLDAERVA
jgi:hypothetical protein